MASKQKPADNIKTVNARIIGTTLAATNDGFMANLILEGDGWNGPYGITNHETSSCANSAKAIADILAMTSANTWEELPGKVIRVKLETDAKGEPTTILTVGHPIADQWFVPEQYASMERVADESNAISDKTIDQIVEADIVEEAK